MDEEQKDGTPQKGKTPEEVEKELADLLEDEDMGDDDMALEEDDDEVIREEPKSPPTPVPSPTCEVCKRDGKKIPLVFVNGKFYCQRHAVRGRRRMKPTKKAAEVATTRPPWKKYALQPFDAMRMRNVDTNQLLQAQGGGFSDSVQMDNGDRVVIFLIKKDGTKMKCLEHTAQEVTLTLMEYKISIWGPSSLPPHMAQGRGLTPDGYH